MKVDDAIRSIKRLGSDVDEDFLAVEEAVTILAELVADETLPQETRTALMEVGATLWRLGMG
jgi:uncharacterized protein (UPF0147 family)